jgi:deoxyribodipyrimidine photo-lyase
MGRASIAIVLLNRDLRIHDHPGIRAAEAGGHSVLPLFVFDDRILAATTTGANRVAYLLESLADLRGALRAGGGELYLRRGDPVAETLALARTTAARLVVASADASPIARRRAARLRAGCAALGARLELTPGCTVVEPGELAPAGRTHYQVFTPYFRAWSAVPRRPVLGPPQRLVVAASCDAGALPSLSSLLGNAPRLAPEPSPQREHGGETLARERLAAFLERGGAQRYADVANLPATDGTTRLSAALHFGCLSANELVTKLELLGGPGAAALVRQCAWREFFHQLRGAFPGIGVRDYRPRPVEWREDREELLAWTEGRTGEPLVDAAMHQLRAEGYIHGRARLVAASYLTKSLRHHWLEGARHFLAWLTDGDVANNAGNWQWMAGTGTDSRPNRTLSPSRQLARFDPDRVYAARYHEAAEPRIDARSP